MAAARSRSEEQDFQDAMRASGITKKGEPLARIVWKAAGDVFVAAERLGSLDLGGAFDIADFAHRLFRCKASDVERSTRRKKS
jgi:hypothetical protein